MQLRTWHVELAVVAMVLVGTALLSSKGWVEVPGVFAVLFSFAHAQVADRLAEKEAARLPDERTVDCYAYLHRYYMLKEALWLSYFAVNRASSAIVGALLFIAYPLWRREWRKINPKH